MEDSASSAILAASSIACPFLSPLPLPTSLPSTWEDEHKATNRYGEGLTETNRIPYGTVVRTLTSDIPPKVVDRIHGLKVVIKLLARVCETSGEQVNESQKNERTRQTAVLWHIWARKSDKGILRVGCKGFIR